MSTTELRQWQQVSISQFQETNRMRVPGGWIYSIHVVSCDAKIIFVPDPMPIPEAPNALA